MQENRNSRSREDFLRYRQLTTFFSLNIRYTKTMNIFKVKKFVNIFIESHSFESDPPRGLSHKAVSCYQWCWYAVVLAAYLLEKAGFPVFEKPTLQGVVELDGRIQAYKVGVRFPSIDNVSQDMYLEAIKTVNDAFNRYVISENLDEKREEIFAFLDQQMVSKFKQYPGGGTSTVQILKSAHSLAIPFRHIGGGVYRLGWGANSRLLDRSSTEADSALGGRLSHDKAVAANVIRSIGLPAPEHQVVTSLEDASKSYKVMNSTVVVKSVDGDRGEGVTVDIMSERKLHEAFITALENSKSRRVLVERQVSGMCHRVFIVNSKLLYAVKRMPISLKGDGHSSIRTLMEKKLNSELSKPIWDRSRIVAFAKADIDVLDTGVCLTTVPAIEEWIPLRKIESTEWGGIDEDATTTIHSENIDIAVRAAGAFGLYVAGVDIISPDISVPWYENQAVINEVNFSPLLGGGDISRHHIPRFLSEYLKDGGRIPIRVVIGGKSAWDTAVELQKKSGESGLSFHITDGNSTYKPDGSLQRYPFADIKKIIVSLINDYSVSGIIIVISSDDLSDDLVPLEIVDEIIDVSFNR